MENFSLIFKNTPANCHLEKKNIELDKTVMDSIGESTYMPPCGTQFFRFHIHFQQKVPVSEIHAPSKRVHAPHGRSWIYPWILYTLYYRCTRDTNCRGHQYRKDEEENCYIIHKSKTRGPEQQFVSDQINRIYKKGNCVVTL